MSYEVKTKERGWPGHFVYCAKCVYHRNTLIEVIETNTRVIVSTCGDCRPGKMGEIGPVRSGVFYETMAFHADFISGYWDMDGTENIRLQSQSEIKYHDDGVHTGTYNYADDMHDSIVKEFVEYLREHGTVGYNISGGL